MNEVSPDIENPSLTGSSCQLTEERGQLNPQNSGDSKEIETSDESQPTRSKNETENTSSSSTNCMPPPQAEPTPSATHSTVPVSTWRKLKASKIWMKLKKPGLALLWLLWFTCRILVLLVICFPYSFLISIYTSWIEVSFTVDGVNRTKYFQGYGDEDDKEKGIYRSIGRNTLTLKAWIKLAKSILLYRLGSLFLLWLPLTLYVPRLKESTVFGVPHWKWTLFAITLFCSSNVIDIFIHLFPRSSKEKNKNKHKKLHYTEMKIRRYYARGLRGSLTETMASGFLLVVWLVYFRTEHGLKTDKYSWILPFVTCFFVSIFVWSILVVVKTFLLLKWKAKAIYRRFKCNALVAGFRLYFLALITDGTRYGSILMPWWDGNYEVPIKSTNGGEDNRSSHRCCYDTKAEDREKGQYNIGTKEYMLKQTVTLSQREKLVTRILRLARVPYGVDGNDGTPEIELKWRNKAQQLVESLDCIVTKEDLKVKYNLKDEEAELLYAELESRYHGEEKITYEKFIGWMVDSHRNCLALAITIVDSFAVVDTLNLVMNTIITTGVILIWLLITGLATTKILIILASPIIAFSFVIGDSAKTLFQGIIFSFVNHPFDIGDLCIIDGIEMEVQRIKILTTYFKKMGSKREYLLYPNSQLATKTISNLRGIPDPNDEVEFEVNYAARTHTITNLENKIKEFFTRHGDLFESSHFMMVKAVGEKIKIVVQFTHKMGAHDMTHSQYFHKKTKQRSIFLAATVSMIEDLQSVETPKTSEMPKQSTSG